MMAPKRKNPSDGANKRKRTRHDTAAAAESPPKTTEDPDDGPVFFWRPHEAATGYLSQWYALPFRDRTDSGKIYATAEHYMMHHKALLFGDEAIAAEILKATSPHKVRALGRVVRGFDQEIWAQEREKIVTEGNWCKFSRPVVEDAGGVVEKTKRAAAGDGQEDGVAPRTWKLGDGDKAQTMQANSFRDVLLATGTRELVEASRFDRIWGVGYGAKNAEKNRDRWGLNLLGKCLMNVREQFREDIERA